MTLAKDLADLNEFHFFKEFTFSKTTFLPAPATEVELADNVVWLDDIFLVYQLKQRMAPANTDVEIERRWFENKVLGIAAKQVRDTLKYLDANKEIQISNHRERKVILNTGTLPRPQKVIVYQANPILPAACRMMKFHRSSTAGIMHLFPIDDYTGVVETLITPTEIMEYLQFREILIDVWGERVKEVPEQALVGQYIRNALSEAPSMRFANELEAFDNETNSWNIAQILRVFLDRTPSLNAGIDYYPIIRELAKLHRSELGAFKERIVITMEKARAGKYIQPYRMAVPRTDCGFVFVPLTKELHPQRLIGLKNLTDAHKYDQRLGKCIGVCVYPDTGNWFTFDWCYSEWSWEQEPELDKLLSKSNPFRPVRSKPLERYKPKSP